MRRRVLAATAFLAICVTLTAVWLYPVSRCGVPLAEEEFRASVPLRACSMLGDPEAIAWKSIIMLVASSSEPPYGDGLRMDHLARDEVRSKARRLLIRAAEAGIPLAQNELGNMYRDGSYGFPVDLNRSRKWFETGLNNQDGMAAWNLARMYADGIGVPSDLQTALKYLGKSVELGYGPSVCATMKFRARRSEFAEDDRLQLLAKTLEKTDDEFCKPKWATILDRIGSQFRSASWMLAYTDFSVRSDTELPDQSPSPIACSVYSSFTPYLGSEEELDIYLAPTTITDTHTSIDPFDWPDVFKVPIEAAPETSPSDWPSPEIETFNFPTDRFLASEPSKGETNLKHCDGLQGAEFWNGSFRTLQIFIQLGSDTLKQKFYYIQQSFYFIQYSNVMVSPDEEYALVYTTLTCGFLCGQGQYSLLRHTTTGWEEIGTVLDWVS